MNRAALVLLLVQQLIISVLSMSTYDRLHKELYDTSMCKALPGSDEYANLHCVKVNPTMTVNVTLHGYTSRGLQSLQSDITSSLLNIREILCSTPAPTVLEHGCGVGRGLLEVRAINPAANITGINKRGYDYVQVNGATDTKDITIWNSVADFYQIPMFQCKGVDTSPYAPVVLVEDLVRDKYLLFPSAHFDFIYSQNALDIGKIVDVNDSHRWVVRFLRLLKPGGVMIAGLTVSNKIARVPKSASGIEIDHGGLEFFRYAQFIYTDMKGVKDQSLWDHTPVEVVLFRSPQDDRKFRPIYCIILKSSPLSPRASQHKPGDFLHNKEVVASTISHAAHVTGLKEYMHKYRKYSTNNWEGHLYNEGRKGDQRHIRKVSVLEKIVTDSKLTFEKGKDGPEKYEAYYEYQYYKNLLKKILLWEQYGVNSGV